ncbi:hypothetical protein DOM21_01260 [Bacteriovorax stolpii]|uniref:Uncharacterized protein n=1 Tax=Bacteriovorax stolpii TaxID=960 RepID=A0A2K9NWM7_BACTC|nr:SGNH/GDSL hydrolase family protein [Bacteriovorax stolpii]AUN99900.1 hypothetical protein C0V70_17670 [Bacteriovorax stolpii]QDK40107.1 hypothetical protein DOM21_01260 [Bacteriovorax stolpii]TDP54207.1 GDSL-like lipase/acylhydrolase family protein [Bacteriovorax stolpii]
MKEKLKTISFYTIQLFICAIILELTCNLFLQHSTNPLYRARKILQYDFDLGWMQKPNLKTTFEKQPVLTNDNGFRLPKNNNQSTDVQILTLGPSSAFGWGVANEDTYTSIIGEKLKLNPLNASGIGHSILQGQKMWQKVSPLLHPQYAVIAYGVNDLDKFRFFDSEPVNDLTFFSQGPYGLAIDKMQLPTDFASSLSLVLRQIEHSINCEKLVNSAQRVEWKDYENALTAMTNEMKEKNITPIIINTPFLLKHKNSLFSKTLIENTYLEMKNLARNKKCKEAQEKLKFAKTLEPDNINISVIEFNGFLKKFCEEKKLKCIDSWSLLVNSSATNNFYDPVHPSAKGHKLIADEIVKLIQQKN